jgi:hypothetical protein
MSCCARGAGALLIAAIFPSLASSKLQSVDLSLFSTQTVSCEPQAALTLPRDLPSAPNLPILLFTCQLSALPLELLRTTSTVALAVPSTPPQQNPNGDADIRAATRAGAHVVLPAATYRRFKVATGRTAIFALADLSQNAVQGTYNLPRILPLFSLDTRGGGVLRDADAVAWLRERASTSTIPHSRRRVAGSVELLMTPQQVQCAYRQLECDFVAEGEVFRTLCQSLRDSYFAHEAVDLFKFALRADHFYFSPPNDSALVSSHSSDAKKPQDLQLHEAYLQKQHSSGFVEMNRDRIEAAYARLVSESAASAAPIKEVLFALYAPENMAEHTPVSVKTRVLKMIGTSSRYEDFSVATLKSSKLLFLILGAALLVRGARGTAAVARRLAGCYPNQGTTGKRIETWCGGRMDRGESRGICRLGRRSTPGSVVIPEFLASRVQSLSKAM